MTRLTSARRLAVTADPAKLEVRRETAPGRENLDLVSLPNGVDRFGPGGRRACPGRSRL